MSETRICAFEPCSREFTPKKRGRPDGRHCSRSCRRKNAYRRERRALAARSDDQGPLPTDAELGPPTARQHVIQAMRTPHGFPMEWLR